MTLTDQSHDDELAADFDQIGENVLRELQRRLSDPRAAEALPGTLLMKLAENYLRFMERKSIQDRTDVPVPAIELINHDGLPVGKRIKIAEAFLEEIETERQEVSDLLQRLHEKAD